MTVPPATQLYSDSLLGVGSVIEAMDSLGFAFHTANDTRNITRQAKSSQRNTLRGSIMGRRGLKSAPVARNAAAQTYLPAPTACSKTTMAPAETAKVANTVRELKVERHYIPRRKSNAEIETHFMIFVSIFVVSSLSYREDGTGRANRTRKST